MIDEKKLIGDLIDRKLYCSDFMLDSIEEDCLIDGINEQPKVGEWIPCSERLPECSGEYQVTYEWLDFRYVKNANYEQLKTKGKWNTKEKVIAWKPLPEPYKGE